jgi:hypothetical protein
LRDNQPKDCLGFRNGSLGQFATFPLYPPEADVAADIVLRRLVPILLQKSAIRVVAGWRELLELAHAPSIP